MASGEGHGVGSAGLPLLLALGFIFCTCTMDMGILTLPLLGPHSSLASCTILQAQTRPAPLLFGDAPGVLLWPHSIAKKTRARGGRGWEGREHLCLIHLIRILQVRKLRPLAHSCTTSKSPEFLYAFSVPRGTAQWLPKARGTEAPPAGSFVRAIQAVFHRTQIQADHLRALAPKQWAYSVTFVSQDSEGWPRPLFICLSSAVYWAVRMLGETEPGPEEGGTEHGLWKESPRAPSWSEHSSGQHHPSALSVWHRFRRVGRPGQACRGRWLSSLEGHLA